MANNVLRSIAPLLEELSKENLKLLRRDLFQLQALHSKLHISEIRDRALQVLEKSSYEMVSAAVAKVLPISRSPSAFAEVEQASILFFLQVSQELETWNQTRVPLPAAKAILDDIRARTIRQQIQRLLDNYYRSEFVSGSPGPARRKSPAGAKEKYDWAGANNEIWALIFHGEINPVTHPLADIERAFADYFSELGGDVPAEPTIRDRANRIKKLALREA